MTTTLGDLISGLFEVYEGRYEDAELATVKTALVVDELLRTSGRLELVREAATSESSTFSHRPQRSARGSARKAA